MATAGCWPPIPQNVGREEKWFESSRPDAKPTKVPWVIQDAFPGYHGVVWYWKAFSAPELESPEPAPCCGSGRFLYKADVWLNGTHVGGNEGAEMPFALDVTETLRPGAANLLAVRVVHPAEAGGGTDGILLGQIPGGGPFNHGGIQDSVELLIRPAVFLKDVYVHSDPATGRMEIEATLHNSRSRAVTAAMVFSIDPTGVTSELNPMLEPGDTVVRGQLQIEKPRLWNLDDPFLYHLKTRVQAQDSAADEQTVRTGFRDFPRRKRAFPSQRQTDFFADGPYRATGPFRDAGALQPRLADHRSSADESDGIQRDPFFPSHGFASAVGFRG